jgi:hypothetical protein
MLPIQRSTPAEGSVGGVGGASTTTSRRLATAMTSKGRCSGRSATTVPAASIRRSSLKAGIVAPSVMLRKLAAYRRQNQLDLALQELRRIERSCSCSTGSKARNCADAAMPGSTRASSVISSRRSSAPSNKAGKQGRQTRPDCRPQCRGAAVSCLRPQPRHLRDRVLELHLHRRRHRPSPCD